MNHVDPDDILKQAIRNLAGGVDIEQAHEVVGDVLTGLASAAKAFKDMNFKEEPFLVRCPSCEKKFEVQIPIKPETLAKAMSHAAKVIDETARLTQFVEGKADSRPDLGTVGGLSGLSWLQPQQLAQVMEWAVEAEARARA